MKSAISFINNYAIVILAFGLILNSVGLITLARRISKVGGDK